MIFLFVFLSAFARTTGDTFFDGKSGFSISKPADWEFVREKKSYGLQLKDGKMTAPEPGTIVTFAKSMGDKFFGVPPTVGVRYLNSVKPGADLAKWLEGELKSQATHDKYFVPASTAITTTIDPASRPADPMSTPAPAARRRFFGLTAERRKPRPSAMGNPTLSIAAIHFGIVGSSPRLGRPRH